VSERRLLRKREVVPLAPKVFDTLLLLVENAGHLIEKNTFMEKLWPDTFVGEDALARNISILRRALGGSSDSQAMIATVPKRGYRFVTEVAEAGEGEAAEVQAFQTADLWHIAKALKEQKVQERAQGVLVTGPNPPVGTNGDEISPQAIAARDSWSRTARPRWVRVSLFIMSMLALGASAGVITFRLQQRAPSPTIQDIRITKLTNHGAVTGVAISLDGRYVVYAKRQGEKQSLWLRQVATEGEAQILPPGTGFHGLTFSPDNNYIFFVRSDEKNSMFKRLYSIPTAGGPVKKLFSDVDSPVSLSPDGRHFVYERCVAGHDDIELLMADADGNNEHVLATIHNATSLLFQPGPNWSPDGHTIAVPALLVGPRTEWALELVNVADGKVRSLYARSHPIGRAVWLKNDTLLEPLFEQSEQRAQLWTISFPEGKLRRFSNDLTSYGSFLDDYGFPLDRSADGKMLVALATKIIGEVWEVPAGNSSQARQITKQGLPLLTVTQAEDGQLWSAKAGVQLWTARDRRTTNFARSIRSPHAAAT
jgi:DNA-binding winged helix-turn-helix (wHTH) protein